MRKVYYNNFMARLFLWRKGFNTAMFFGFICTKRKATEPLTLEAINHEAIHVEQYAEITAVALVLAAVLAIFTGWTAWPFIVAILLYYIVYFVEAGISWGYHTIRRKKGTSATDKAYYTSMFEMEAHAHEDNIGYIPIRKSAHWLRNFGKI